MTFKVELSDRARRDIEDQYEWIAGRSLQGANRWYKELMSALNRLRTESSTPGSVAPESDDFVDELRETFFRTPHGRTFRLLFTVSGEVVSLLAVRSAGQRNVDHRDVDLN